MRRWILPIILATAGACPAVETLPLEKLPVQEGGRKKPYLVFAEESMLGVSGKKALVLEGKKVGAMEFVTGLWLAPGGWEKLPVVLVNHQPLKELCNLEGPRKWFSYDELAGNPALRELLGEAAALRARPGNNRLSGLPKEAADVGLRLGVLEELASGEAFRVVPHPGLSDGQWSPVEPSRLAPLQATWQAGDSEGFRIAAEGLIGELGVTSPAFQPLPWRIELEALYQKTHPIRWAWVFYLAAGVVLLLGMRSPGTYATGWALAIAGFVLQVLGFAARIAISGRPPVTNMYESVVWVAFGTVAIALVFEAIHRSRVILLSAIPVAVVSLILADSLPQSLSRSINPLVPVLRDNFWLTTHVLTITLSYAAFALALGIAHVALGTVIAGKKPRAELYNYLYRVLQVGVLLLTVGTILGAVWANYSWGRFWDWDPKEVWALVTLLTYLFVLHGRIAGKWAGFGMAVGAVVCFLSVLMAWYGVNFVLGVGLHSYGFGSGGFGYAAMFVAAELVFVAVAIGRKALSERSGRAPTGGSPQSPTTTGVPSLTRS